MTRSTSSFAASLLILSCALPTSSSAQETTSEESVEEILAAPPPSFEARYPTWLAPELSLGAGVGGYALSNPGGEGIDLSGAGLNVEALIGDRYFGFISYYVPLRLMLLRASGVTIGGEEIDYAEGSDQNALMLNTGLGVQVWVVPRFVFVSAEAGLNTLQTNIVGADIDSPRVEDRALMPSLRVRAGVRLKSVTIAGEYAQLRPGDSRDAMGQWSGRTIFFNVSLAPDLTMQNAGEILTGLKPKDDGEEP